MQRFVPCSHLTVANHTVGTHSGNKVTLNEGPATYKLIYGLLVYDVFSDIKIC
jgi:hypothetical protein